MSAELHLVYDGDCGFCRRSLAWFERVDVWQRYVLHDARRRAEIAARFPMLDGADFDDAMFAVQGDRVWRGFFAFRQMIWHSPVTWLLIPLFYAPGARWAGPKIYAWVAAHRRQLGCGDTCAIPTAPGAGPEAPRYPSER